jgi:hypothetical protein
LRVGFYAWVISIFLMAILSLCARRAYGREARELVP